MRNNRTLRWTDGANKDMLTKHTPKRGFCASNSHKASDRASLSNAELTLSSSTLVNHIIIKSEVEPNKKETDTFKLIMSEYPPL